MATVAEMLDKVARECRAPVPNNWVSSLTTTSMDLKDYLSDTIDELLERIDWPDPITKDTTITGTGDEDYDLPADFKRLTRDPYTVYETTTTRRPGVPISSNGAWTALKQMGSAGGDRYFRTSGNEEDGYQISFYRNPSASESITVSYVSTNWLSTDGTAGAEFDDVNAILLLPRRLVEEGMIWRFRRAKGQAYADRLNGYEAMLARHANDKRVIRRVDITGEAKVRSPFDIPVPDYIPQA